MTNVCKPWHYLVIMRQMLCVVLLVLFCIWSFLHSIIQLGTIYGLPMSLTILFLTCSLIETHQHWQLHLWHLSGGQWRTDVHYFVSALISYGIIFHSKESESGREAESLHTCIFHITVAGWFFVPCVFMYARPANTFSIDKLLNVFYTIISPMLNPLINSLNNSELTNAMKNSGGKHILSSSK